MDAVELLGFDNGPIQPGVFGNGSSSADRKNDVCVFVRAHACAHSVEP